MHPVHAIEDELPLLKISVDRSFDEVFWLDFESNIHYVNDAGCRITGYSREELCDRINPSSSPPGTGSG